MRSSELAEAPRVQLYEPWSVTAAVNDHRLGVGHPHVIVKPNRHAGRGEGLNPACPSAWRAPAGDHLHVNAAFLGTDQRANNAGADRQPVSGNEDLVLGGPDRALRKTGAIVLGGETNLDHGVGGDGRGR